MARYNKIFYRDKSIKTIKELFDKEHIVNISVKDFLDVKNPYTGQTNREAIFVTLSKQSRKLQNITSARDINESTKITPPVTFWVTIDNIKVNLIENESKFVKYKDVDAFLSEEIKQIITHNIFGNKGRDYTHYEPEINVLLWSKSLDNKTVVPRNYVNGALIDISQFISSATIGNYDTGGNFTLNISLIPVSNKAVISDTDDRKSKIWDIDSNILMYTKNGKNNAVVTSFIHKHSGIVIGRGDIFEERTIDFGTVGINTNDIVFIKMTKLNRKREINNFYVNNNELVGENFDMIALIDNVNVSYETNDITITITGRDLMKLIADDGSFFFPNSYSNQDASGVFINQTENGDAANTLNKYFKSGTVSHSRFVSTGLILPFFNPTARTIKAVVTLVISKLANIQICPDSLFESYGKKRTKFLEEKNEK